MMANRRTLVLEVERRVASDLHPDWSSDDEDGRTRTNWLIASATDGVNDDPQVKAVEPSLTRNSILRSRL